MKSAASSSRAGGASTATQDRAPRRYETSEAGSLPDNQEGRSEGRVSSTTTKCPNCHGTGTTRFGVCVYCNGTGRGGAGRMIAWQPGIDSNLQRAGKQPVRVAALFVYKDGPYDALPGVEVWDEERDARLYGGPHPVVAHPPCKAWSLMGNCRPEIPKDEDGGCFAAALAAVRKWGGVLEHPAHTRAWKRYGLHRPPHIGGWVKSLLDDGWVCEVDQRWYGHEANNPTWLYYSGDDPPTLRWGRAPVGDKTVGRSWGQGRDRGRSGTPPAFRDVLLDMARSANKVTV